ncbi:MAG: hypothetical protein ACI9MC_003706 [Kiritimatiellia bacterium]
MTNGTILGSDDTRKVLVDIMDGLERRPDLPGGAAGDALDIHLLRLVAGLDRAPNGLTMPIDEPPPRPVAVAMALTLFSQPHLVSTLAAPSQPHASRPPSRPIAMPIEEMSEVLGLAAWELDELQGEIDRRVSLYLKQQRALNWLWSHFGLPDAGVKNLVRLLFPAIDPDGVGPVGLSRRGAQLYAVVDQTPPPRPDAMYAAWLDRHNGWAPCGTFSGRYVDPALRRQLSRSIGADDDEVILILDRMISVIPRAQSGAFLEIDKWRAMPYDASCGLVGSYSRAAWLSDALRPEDVDFRGWLRRKDNAIIIENGKALFDTIALTRVCLTARQLHGHLLATVLARGERPMYHPANELVRYDARRHMHITMEPLLEWTKGDQTAEHVAKKLGVEVQPAREALQKLHKIWERHLDTTWSSLPRTGPASVASRLCAQLIRTRHSVGQHYARGCANELEHREALLMFAAHYFAEAPLDRLWARDDDGLSEDPIGRWFWPIWLRVTQNIETEHSVEQTFHL